MNRKHSGEEDFFISFFFWASNTLVKAPPPTDFTHQSQFISHEEHYSACEDKCIRTFVVVEEMCRVREVYHFDFTRIPVGDEDPSLIAKGIPTNYTG